MNSGTQRERITECIRDVYGAEPEHLWADTPEYVVFRHAASRKWFGILMRIPKSRLGLAGEELVDIMNVKSDPILIGSLRLEKGFFSAYHMNKDSWISVLLDGALADERVLRLVDLSYELVSPRVKARKKSAATPDAKP